MSQENKVLIWRDPLDWNTVVFQLLKLHFPENIRSQIIASPHMFFYKDEIDWNGDKPVWHQKDKEIPGLQKLMESFQQIYTKIRIFHGCRTEDINSYLKYGFLTLDPDEQIQKAIKIFINDLFPQINIGQILDAADKLKNQLRENHLYFCFDDIILIDRAPHYLRYGSEYISALAAELSNRIGDDCRVLLQNVGVPTVFVCDVPISLISKSSIFHLLVDLISHTIYEPYIPGQQIQSIDFTFEFNVSLPANVIKSYYHPTGV